MELLLFLSALLTALTGAVSGVRAPEAQVHQSCGTFAGLKTVPVVRVAPMRRAQHWLALAELPSLRRQGAPNALDADFALFRAAPLYLDKPRE